MHNLKLKLAALLQSLDNNHADQIVAIDVSHQASFTDFIIICNARSSRHMRAIVAQVIAEMKAIKLHAISHQGTAEGEWALIDFADFVVNIMLPTTRDFYNLDGFWQPAVNSQLGT